MESIFLQFEAGQSERQLRIPNGNWKIKEALRILGEVQKVEYTATYTPISVAREQQENYRQEGNTGMELLMRLKALFGSPLCKAPKPWDNGKF